MLVMNPEQALAEGFAQQMQMLAHGAGADPLSIELLGNAARAASLATSSGHVCVSLKEALNLGEDQFAEARARLLHCGLVASSDSPASLPLILDDNDRLYLTRYFDYERRLAAALIHRASPLPNRLDASDKGMLDELFGNHREGQDSEVDWQKLACALAMRNRLTVIAGGPGTGKTTIVLNLLAALLTKQPQLRVALAAPTGKAAQRMREAIRSRSANISPDLLAKMPREVHTLHRLLGVVAGSPQFRHGPDQPLPIDLLVVDEASMLDLALATKLLDAVPENARVIFLGDKDQLAAVEAGAVFNEISCDATLGALCAEQVAEAAGIDRRRVNSPPAQRQSPLQDTVIWLTKTHRFGQDSGIYRLATCINDGAAEAAVAQLRSPDEPNLGWVDDGGPRTTSNTLQSLLDQFAGYRKAVDEFDGDASKVFASFDCFRILCAVRSSARGVEQVNREMTVICRRQLNEKDEYAHTPWFPGRPVMVLRNDYGLGLFNGDVGLTLPDENGRLLTYFPISSDRYLALSPGRLPPHETAFAMTVHKSQGSEFQSLALILPSSPSRVLTKELIYTAVTRARESVTLYGSLDILSQAIVTPTQRNSGLLARLWEQARNPVSSSDAKPQAQT